MKKRRIPLMLVTLLLLPLLCFSAHAQEADFLGRWYLLSMEFGGMTFNAADLLMEATLDFLENGEVELVINDETDALTWQKKGSEVRIGTEDDLLICTVDGDSLTLVDGEETMFFGRDPEQPGPLAEAALREGAALEDYAGEWLATRMAIGSMSVPAADMDRAYRLTVEGGVAGITIFDVEYTELLCAMDGDSLVLEMPDGPMRLSLHEDGRLSHDLGDGSVLWFDRQEKSAEEATPPETDALPAPLEASGNEAGYYVLDSVSDGEITMGRAELTELGLTWSITLQEDGSARIHFDEPYDAVWADGVITLSFEGETELFPYTLDQGTLILDMDGERAVFMREGDAPTVPAIGGGDLEDEKEPVAEETPVDEEELVAEEEPVGEETPVDKEEAVVEEEPADHEADTEAVDATPLQQWWVGEWYGYWTVSGVTDAYDTLDDGRWDCYAQVDLAADGAGSISVWTAQGALFTVEITASEGSGSGAMGAAISEGGAYADGADIGRADMIIDPSLYGYENYMVIDGYYESAEDSDEGYYYWVYLRPWGQLWDDIPEDERPPEYASWYLERYTLPMEEAIGTIDAPLATEDVGEEENIPVDAPPATGGLRAECPEGWRVLTAETIWDDEGIDAVELRKGAETEDDRYMTPGMVIYHQVDANELVVPPTEFLDDLEELAPMEIGARTWHGVMGTWLDDQMAILWTEGDQESALEITLWLSISGHTISLDDPDVLEIIASIQD